MMVNGQTIKPFYKKSEKKLNIWLLALPAFFDIIETSFKNVALILIAASVTQMLRSSVVVFTAFLSVVFLKKRLYRHHISSIFLIVLGIFLVGLSSLSSSKSSNIWGIIMLLFGQLSGAMGYVVEEKFLGDFDNLDPYYMAGVEGLFAVAIWTIALPIL